MIACDCMNPWHRDLEERIVELEAELADGYACHVAAHALLEDRAEKAEAEVEWLKKKHEAYRALNRAFHKSLRYGLANVNGKKEA